MEAAVNDISSYVFDKTDLNKERILSILGHSANSPVYFKVLLEYDEMKSIFYSRRHLKCGFTFEKNNVLSCSSIIYVGITIGAALSETIDELFAENRYFSAIMLNAMCDDYIMSADNVLMDNILFECRERNLNAVKKYSPHENIDPFWAKSIADKLKFLNLEVNEAYGIFPTKTLVYIIAANECKSGAFQNSCAECKFKDRCLWKT